MICLALSCPLWQNAKTHVGKRKQIKSKRANFEKTNRYQLKDKNALVHEKIFGVVVAMAKSHPDVFDSHAGFYIKRMMTHLINQDNKSVFACEKAIREILKTTANLKKLVRVFGATAQDKSTMIRKHSFVFLKSILERWVVTPNGESGDAPKKSAIDRSEASDTQTDEYKFEKMTPMSAAAAAAPPPPEEEEDLMKGTTTSGGNSDSAGNNDGVMKETLDLITESLKLGMKDMDKLVRMEAMECTNILNGIDEHRTEDLVSTMAAPFRKTYLQKYGDLSLQLEGKDNKYLTLIAQKGWFCLYVHFFFFFFL
ncbi:hypothetical protein RFI_30475 [Reticulomyxa filosa]|uniref:Uncharacterized protein n=1 Tax=Reticulomyxa filosa TaxID=46433 RepID=X6LZ97_RETFI|nr:hypothetical protein RFI_30475 [Reticulomyxa filosa]|eukprot:ETO06919.1 hypothetical protein RFI_30475 [Reticulomyxa filosa]